jgi:hypothetical protein
MAAILARMTEVLAPGIVYIELTGLLILGAIFVFWCMWTSR